MHPDDLANPLSTSINTSEHALTGTDGHDIVTQITLANQRHETLEEFPELTRTDEDGLDPGRYRMGGYCTRAGWWCQMMETCELACLMRSIGSRHQQRIPDRTRRRPYYLQDIIGLDSLPMSIDTWTTAWSASVRRRGETSPRVYCNSFHHLVAHGSISL